MPKEHKVRSFIIVSAKTIISQCDKIVDDIINERKKEDDEYLLHIMENRKFWHGLFPKLFKKKLTRTEAIAKIELEQKKSRINHLNYPSFVRHDQLIVACKLRNLALIAEDDKVHLTAEDLFWIHA